MKARHRSTPHGCETRSTGARAVRESRLDSALEVSAPFGGPPPCASAGRSRRTDRSPVPAEWARWFVDSQPAGPSVGLSARLGSASGSRTWVKTPFPKGHPVAPRSSDGEIETRPHARARLPPQPGSARRSGALRLRASTTSGGTRSFTLAHLGLRFGVGVLDVFSHFGDTLPAPAVEDDPAFDGVLDHRLHHASEHRRNHRTNHRDADGQSDTAAKTALEEVFDYRHSSLHDFDALRLM